MRDAIETLLRQKIGLDSNSIGSRTIARVVEQRRKECHLPTQAAYLDYLTTSPHELTRLIEAIVVPETWFFRDYEPFVYLSHYVKTEWQFQNSKVLRILSAPCSTGEEAYSIAIALLESGLRPDQFRIDAVDISQPVLEKARQAIYGKRSFRGQFPFERDRYFETIGQDWQVRSFVQQTVKFRQANLIEPGVLQTNSYQVIFCRNLLIYLDSQSRTQLLQTLDQILSPDGLLFVGAVETGQLTGDRYTSIDHPRAFAFRKQNRLEVSRSRSNERGKSSPMKPLRNSKVPVVPLPTLSATAIAPSLSPTQTSLETAEQLANDGQLTRAATLCQSYLRANPTQTQGHVLLGEIYQGMHQFEQAESCFQKAVYLNPNHHKALLHLALLKEMRGDRVGSESLKRRLQRLINHQEIPNSQPLLNRQA